MGLVLGFEGKLLVAPCISCNMQSVYIQLSLHSHRESLRARNGIETIVRGVNALQPLSTDLLSYGTGVWCLCYAFRELIGT
jgi:hypothetical protein